MTIIDSILKLSLKDWLILAACVALFFCLWEIGRLKKMLAREAKKNLTPQLTAELILDEGGGMGLYLKNDWFFIAHNIKIEPAEITLSDFGFNAKNILEFEGIEVLLPQERKQLQLKVYDEGHHFLPEVTEKIIPHLVSPVFKLSIFFSSIDGTKFHAILSKKGKAFYNEMAELAEKNI